MMAVIKTGGKQYVVKEGDLLKVEKLEAKVGERVSFEALLVADGINVQIGTPLLSNKIEAEVVKQGVGKKISVVHYKPKVRHKNRSGHRQMFTEVKIGKI